MTSVRMRDLVLTILDHTLFRPGRSADYECPTDWKVDGLEVSDYDLWYIREGTGWIRINETEYTLSPHDLYLFKPGDTVTAAQDPTNRLTVYYSHFSPDISPLFSRLLLPQRYRAEDDLVERAFSLFFLDKRTYGSVMPFGVRLLLYSIIRIWLFAGAVTLQLDESVYGRVGVLLRAIDYLRAHALGQVSLDELSPICHLEKSGVIRLFREYTGKTPMQFHAYLKMGHAADLLEVGFSVKDVALRTGYSDMFAFSKAFKKQTGESPRSFVRNKNSETLI